MVVLSPFEECEEYNVVKCTLRWRAEYDYALRTAKSITETQQQKWYDEVTKRDSTNRFWMIYDLLNPVGCCGIENINWYNRNGEISLLLDPLKKGQGIGSYSFLLLMEKGFKELNLENLYGECYLCNPALRFWTKMVDELGGSKTFLPDRKFYNGQYYNSMYFNFNKKDWKK